MSGKKQFENGAKVLFFLTALFYVIWYVPYGLEGTDTGYIFGNSWSIYNGLLPHRDFIYTRPAIPAYFHTLFLFISETHGYLLDRIFFYIQVFSFSYFGVKLVFQKLQNYNNVHLYLLATLGALFSIHNYPAMGWNTVDGIFFMVVGLYLLLKNRANWLSAFLGVLFLVAGTFSKQSFYFMPIFIFIYLLFQKDWKTLKWYCGFGILWVAIYIGIKLSTGTWYGFIEDTFVRTDSSALIDAGVKEYYLALKIYLIWALAVVVIGYLIKRFTPDYIGFSIVFSGILFFIGHHFLNDASVWSKIPVLFQLWLVFSFCYVVWLTLKDKKYGLVLVLLALSWSAGISNGYRTPILFSVPLVLSLYFFFRIERVKISNIVFFAAVILTAGVFFIGYQTVYRESPRNELTYNMGSVFPQLAGIKSDKEGFDKFTELKNLAEKYSNFTVLPSITQAHYLTRTVNPIGTDWPLDVEINSESALLEARLIQKGVTVFMEKNEFTKKELEGYSLVSAIENTWQLIDETTYFRVYKSK